MADPMASNSDSDEEDPAKERLRPHCYICASKENLTEDHIPPEGFFPPEQRHELLTAPLCQPCHTPLTKMDEKMRLWLSAGGGRTNAGKWIWENKVVGSTFKRSPKLAQYVRIHHFRPIIDEAGTVVGGRITMPQGCAVPFIRRLTKGILYNEHPSYDYSTAQFTVDCPSPHKESVEALRGLVSQLPQLARGDGVFRSWHGIAADNPDAGVCVYLFYDSVCFVCLFSKGDEFRQEFCAGYREEPGLPPLL